MMKEKQKTNRVLTIVLILGTVTVFFPLYMAAIIAFKKPSEMTNDVAGALSFPKQWSFENFRQAMEVTDFWRSLGNSLLITLVTIVLAILIHSIAGYVIGRDTLNRLEIYLFSSSNNLGSEQASTLAELIFFTFIYLSFGGYKYSYFLLIRFPKIK